MWILIVLPGILLLLFMLVLLTSIEIEISSLKNVYEVRFGRLFRAGFEIGEEGTIGIRIKYFFQKKYFSIIPPETNKKKKQKKPKEKGKEGKRKKPPVKNIFRRILSLLKSFEVRRMHVNIDTDDYVLNSWLFPAAFFLKRKTGQNISVNFLGINEVDILLRNNLLRMGFAFLRYK